MPMHPPVIQRLAEEGDQALSLFRVFSGLSGLQLLLCLEALQSWRSTALVPAGMIGGIRDLRYTRWFYLRVGLLGPGVTFEHGS